jgi:hypothetical protein
VDEQAGGMLDEVYHGTWFNKSRRIEAIKVLTARSSERAVS